MKYFVCLFFATFLCLHSIIVFGQTETDVSFQTAMNNAFAGLDKSKVPYGLLRDYAFEFTNLENFSGSVTLADSNYTDAAVFWEVYNTLLTAKVSGLATGLPNQTTIENLWFQNRQPGRITLSGLYFNYSRLKDNAHPGYVTVTGNQLYDKYVGGVWQNPYQTENVFCLAPLLTNTTMQVLSCCFRQVYGLQIIAR